MILGRRPAVPVQRMPGRVESRVHCAMLINNLKCQDCKDFHAPREGVAAPPISEAQILKRSGTLFYECPSCSRLYAAKLITGSVPPTYTIISSASVTVLHEWIVDAEDGSRQKAKYKMTEEEAARRHSNAVKIPVER